MILQLRRDVDYMMNLLKRKIHKNNYVTNSINFRQVQLPAQPIIFLN